MKEFFSSASGVLFNGDSRDLCDCVGEGCVDLVLTSPPFALVKKKAYGNAASDEYLDWIKPILHAINRVVSDNGSIVLDFGSAYVKGHPVRSLYHYEVLFYCVKELGWNLCQEFYHHNPSRLPSPAQWVTVKRIRVKDSVNVVYWFSKSARPHATNRSVLVPYSESMKKLLEKQSWTAGKRPSGHVISGNFGIDNGGAIPGNLLSLSNSVSSDPWMKLVKKEGLPVHPARFPTSFADFFIRFLTEEGGLVCDPFAGSNTTGFVAEKLNRKWVGVEMSEEYCAGAALRWS